jgi:hypothetical protein
MKSIKNKKNKKKIHINTKTHDEFKNFYKRFNKK